MDSEIPQFKSVPQHLVKRLEELKARRSQMCRRSTAARSLQIKKQILETVAAGMDSPSDRALLNVDVDEQLDLLKAEEVKRRRWGRKRKTEEVSKEAAGGDSIIEDKSLRAMIPRPEKNFEYPEDEDDLEVALKAKRVKQAVHLSDQMIIKQKEEESRAMRRARSELQRRKMEPIEKRKKKIQWTFRPKSRWESKCNM